MSQESKEYLEKTKKYFEKIGEGQDQVLEQTKKFGDKELVKKIQRVKEDVGEVVKHIEKRGE